MRMRKLHVLICMQLQFVARASYQEIHQTERRKKNVNVTNLERLFRQTSDKLYIVISALCVRCAGRDSVPDTNSKN